MAVSDEACRASGQSCNIKHNKRIIVAESPDFVRGALASFTWNGNPTSGGLFSGDINGDHCFTCKASHGGVTREFDAGCIKGKRLFCRII